MSDIQRKILIDVQYKNEQAVTAVANFKAAQDASNSSVEEANRLIAEAKAAQAQYAAELAKGKVDQQAIKTAYDKTRLSILEANKATKEAKANVQAAAGSYDEAQKKLTALGRAIKSAEGGFRSTNPAIQDQIKEYKSLNKELTAFDEKLGNHQRKVGQYENSLNTLTSQLTGLIPGFDKVSGVLTNAAQAFNAMGNGSKVAAEGATEAGEAAAGAEEGVAGLSAAATGLIAVIAAAVLVVGAFAKAFYELTPQADILAQRWEALKGGYRALMDNINTGRGLGKLADDMKTTAQEAANLKMQLQDLNRAQIADLVDDAKADEKIADLQLKMRNRRNTPEQEKAYFDQIQKISQDKYEGNKKLAEQEYKLAVQTAVNTNRFSDEQKKRLMQDGIDYAIILEKGKGLVNGEADLKAIASAQQKLIATEQEREIIQQRAQNRLDSQMEKADAAAQKMRDDLAAAKQGLDEANNDRIASISRMLQSQQEAFARDLSMNDEHYRQLIFKQEEFIKKQEALAAKTKSPKARATFKQAAAAGRSDIKQLRSEQGLSTLTLIEDHNKAMAEETQKAYNELRDIQIQSIDDLEDRETNALELSTQTKRQALTRERQLLLENQDKLLKELNDKAKPPTAERAKILKAEYDHEQELLNINHDKATEATLADQRGRTEIIKKYSDQRQAEIDKAEVLKAQLADEKSPTRANDKALLEAQQKQLLDQYNADVSQKGLTDATKLRMEQEYLTAKDELNRAYNAKRYDDAVKWEQQIQSAATSIISSAIAHNAQAAEVNLEKAKAKELQNTSLTSTQKEIIEDKYRIKAGQAKVKEFNANKKLQLANALINLMVAEGRLWVDPGFPGAIGAGIALAAEAATQMAVIAAQQPPAYATGGLHYQSDGTGSLLRGPGTGSSDSMNARLSNGESVINAKSTSMFAPLLSAINQAGGGRAFSYKSQAYAPWVTPSFATGGMYNTYIPTADNGLRPSQVTMSSRIHYDDMNTMINGIAGAVMSMPAPIVDVKDINNQQGILEQTKTRIAL